MQSVGGARPTASAYRLGSRLGSGSTITWPAGTFEGQGSGGMASFIQSNVGAIGYIDAGHGHNAGLGEIALQNRDGAYLTTRQADIGAAGTIALAAGSSASRLRWRRRCGRERLRLTWPAASSSPAQPPAPRGPRSGVI